jgi:hypothetical protein
MNCKYGFFTCINCVYETQIICDTCEDGDNYEIDDNIEINENEILQ